MSESPGAYWKARAVEAEAEVTRQREELEDRTNQVRALEEFARLSIETEDQLRQALGRHHVADMREGHLHCPICGQALEGTSDE